MLEHAILKSLAHPIVHGPSPNCQLRPQAPLQGSSLLPVTFIMTLKISSDVTYVLWDKWLYGCCQGDVFDDMGMLLCAQETPNCGAVFKEIAAASSPLLICPFLVSVCSAEVTASHTCLFWVCPDTLRSLLLASYFICQPLFYTWIWMAGMLLHTCLL